MTKTDPVRETPIPKKKRKWRKFLLAILICWTMLYIADSPVPSMKLPEGPITAYLIDGDAHVKLKSDPSPKLHGWPIIEQKTITSPVLAKEIHSVISSRFSYEYMLPTLCFNPHVGFRIGSGDKAVDVLVCLECSYTYFYSNQDLDMMIISWPGRARYASLNARLFPDWKKKVAVFHEQYRKRVEAEFQATTQSSNGQ